MNVRLTRKFGFEAAHRLPNVPASHKCARLHGHSFRVEVSVRGPVEQTMGWFIDYAEIDQACKALTDILDHRYLNEIPGLENPTSERIAEFIWNRLIVPLPSLDAVVVMETCESRCEYRGD
jgi:6-pyruvoyltetrahydropterin/6-carboxytetrahydropterin synthase